MTDNRKLQRPGIVLDRSERKMPVLFVGHGSPMNAIEENEFSRAWIETGKAMPKPKAILCISAHWETDGTKITSMAQPKTIHDFYGFPTALYKTIYPAPGSPELAQLIRETIKKIPASLNLDWGLDHGAWSVLLRMFPDADIPVVQFSLDHTKDASYHYELGKELRSLRYKGILILGSGNMVHNLGMMSWQDHGYDWAIDFDETLKQLILSGNHDSLVHYEKLGKAAHLSIPTNEHYLPFLYTIALQDKEDSFRFFAEQVTLGSISMRSFQIG